MFMIKDKKNIDKKSKETYNKRRVRVGDVHPPFDAKDPDLDPRLY